MTTVLAHGTFDVLHPGHLAHLQEARAYGDRLVVSVTPDAHVAKGPGRPVFTAEQRVMMLNALAVVDEAFIAEGATAIPSIEAVRPDYYVKGSDYEERDAAGNLTAEKLAVEKHGGRLVFTRGVTMSSSEIINRHMPVVSDEVRAYLDAYPYSAADTLGWVEQCGNLTAYAIGESIWDRYIYVEPEGRSAKESSIMWRIVGQEDFAGGIMAARHHMAALCKSATYYINGSILKTRYVWQPFGHKVLGFVPNDYRLQPVEALGKVNADMVVCVDYGHGLIPNADAASAVIEASPFLALNVQANSLNWGLNTLNKWMRADYVVLDEAEMRLAHQDTATPLDELLRRTHSMWRCKMAAVTLGHKGAMLTEGERVVSVPALASKIVDRLGAGDAFLAATAPLVRVGAPLDVVELVGSVAAALQVGVTGNSEPIEKVKVRKWVHSMLK